MALLIFWICQLVIERTAGYDSFLVTYSATVDAKIAKAANSAHLETAKLELKVDDNAKKANMETVNLGHKVDNNEKLTASKIMQLQQKVAKLEKEIHHK